MTSSTDTSTTAESAIAGAADAWLAALNAHDPDAAAAAFAPDAVLVNVGNGQRHEGTEAIRADHVILFGMWSELSVQKGKYIITGDRYADEWIMTGMHTGDVPGLPATGKPFRICGAGFGEVRDGKIVGARVYWSMIDFLTQVGVMPSPGA